AAASRGHRSVSRTSRRQAVQLCLQVQLLFEALQINLQFLDCLISLLSILSQGLLDHPFKLYRDFGRKLSERYRLSFEYRNNHVARRCAVEGHGTGEHLVDPDAEAKDVTARIDRQSAG